MIHAALGLIAIALAAKPLTATRPMPVQFGLALVCLWVAIAP